MIAHSGFLSSTLSIRREVAGFPSDVACQACFPDSIFSTRRDVYTFSYQVEVPMAFGVVVGSQLQGDESW